MAHRLNCPIGSNIKLVSDMSPSKLTRMKIINRNCQTCARRIFHVCSTRPPSPLLPANMSVDRSKQYWIEWYIWGSQLRSFITKRTNFFIIFFAQFLPLKNENPLNFFFFWKNVLRNRPDFVVHFLLLRYFFPIKVSRSHFVCMRRPGKSARKGDFGFHTVSLRLMSVIV